MAAAVRVVGKQAERGSEPWGGPGLRAWFLLSGRMMLPGQHLTIVKTRNLRSLPRLQGETLHWPRPSSAMVQWGGSPLWLHMRITWWGKGEGAF